MVAPSFQEAAGAASRRAILLAPLALAALPAQRAAAFENRLPPDELELKYRSPRTAGPMPIDLGPRAGGGLKACTDGKPHCFSSTPEQLEDSDLYSGSMAEDWLVEAFRYDKPMNEALADVKAAVASYPPGQRGVDGGGFKLVKESTTASSAYLYVQFEAQRKGYIDDFEVSLSDGVANVRTSSRLGYLDLGVNAKRFNWFALRLGSVSGWKTTPIRSRGHENYFAQNRVTDKDVL